MQLSKVIVMSVSAAAVAATAIGVSLFLNTSVTDSSANSYAATPQESEVLIAEAAEAGIYNTSGTVLTESPDNDKSTAEQHSISTEPWSSKGNSALPESIVPLSTSDNGTDALNTNMTVNENKSVHTESGNTGNNDNNPVKSTADADKADMSALTNNISGSSNTLRDTVVSSPASVVSNTDSANKPASVTPDSRPASVVSNTDSANKPAPVTPDNSPANVASDTGNSNKSASVTPDNSPANVASDTNNSDKSAPVTPDDSPANVVSDTDNSDKSAPVTPVSSPSYDHTTSIYTDDWNTLLRVEYYDDNNNLFAYSSVTDYDKDTNSYTETVYRWDEENDEEITMRTDTYVNGELISSESP